MRLSLVPAAVAEVPDFFLLHKSAQSPLTGTPVRPTPPSSRLSPVPRSALTSPSSFHLFVRTNPCFMFSSSSTSPCQPVFEGNRIRDMVTLLLVWPNRQRTRTEADPTRVAPNNAFNEVTSPGFDGPHLRIGQRKSIACLLNL